MELTVPVQVLFATSNADGLMLDCVVAQEVHPGPGSPPVPAGAPFSLLIDAGDVGESEAATRLLERWCSDGAVVQATTSAENRWLILRHEREELTLVVV